jgi:phosphotriesterase-related protein
MRVTTVLGEMDAARLGVTLMHEHVYSLYSDYRNEYGWDEEKAVAIAVDAMTDLVQAGVTAIVDMTVLGLGRSVRRLERISRASGLTILAATGIYTFGDLPNFFRSRTAYVSDDYVSDFFVAEIEDGIGDTGIRPAVIKFATDAQGINDDVALIGRQVARAQLRTGVPIMTHSHSGTRQGLAQQRLLAAEGVDLGAVVIGHAGDSSDLDYLQRLLDNGSWLGMDRFGHEPSAPLAQRIDTVVALCERGYASRMVLSHDTSVRSDSLPDDVRRSPVFANWNFRCIPDLVLPALRERGVSAEDIETMMVRNPRAVLAHADA